MTTYHLLKPLIEFVNNEYHYHKINFSRVNEAICAGEKAGNNLLAPMGKTKAQLRMMKALAKRWSPYTPPSRGTKLEWTPVPEPDCILAPEVSHQV